MNSNEFRKNGITDDEIKGLQGIIPLPEIKTFSLKEKTAIEYVQAICTTPIHISPEIVRNMKREFSEREMVIIASTAAQVNYWTRLIQAFGIQPDGFSESCLVKKDYISIDR